jgi:hypothetical protein
MRVDEVEQVHSHVLLALTEQLFHQPPGRSNREKPTINMAPSGIISPASAS